MKTCLACHSHFETASWTCPYCNISPSIKMGYPAFSPDLAEMNDGFKADYFAELAQLEKKNFWFKSRNQLIIWAIRRYFSHIQNFFEIGCGTGFVLSGIEQAFPNLQLFGSEIFSAGLQQAAQRIKKASFFQMDARHIPFTHEFDLVGAFDVLEHIAEDEQVIAQLFKAIRPGGGLILTVPQHAFLWSQQDEHACHVRRYSALDLKNKVKNAGFNVLKTTSFVSLLLPLMLATRYAKRKSQEGYDALAEFRLPHLINFSLEKILDLERLLIKFGLPLPLGGSLLLIAQKP